MKKQKMKRYIIYAILILFVLCIILVVILNNSKKEQYDNQVYEEFIQDYLEETILPRNLIELYSYKGDNSKDELYKNLRKFVEYISILKNDIVGYDEKQKEEYFKTHSKEILNILGIQDNQNFVNFLKYIENKNIDFEKFQYAEVEKKSSNSDSKYFSFNIHLYYEENLNELVFKVYFANSSSIQPRVKYSIIDN